jgi:transcriptional regulator with XRE-family HTH domain
MDNKKVGQFILELRKSSQMTQKELAEKLSISDKAVSKWERGLSYPDIELLSPLSDILGITTTELLNGERAGREGRETINTEASVTNALEYGKRAAKRKIKLTQNIWAAAFSILLLLGIFVVSIVDMAISGGFTWSLIPISAIIFAWLVCIPGIKFGAKGVVGSLIALSLSIVPFLYALDSLIAINVSILPIGIRMSVISIAFLWVVFGIFKVLKSRKFIASAISLALAIPVSLIINYTLSRIIGGPLFDIWDILSYSLIIVAVITLVTIDFTARKSS